MEKGVTGISGIHLEFSDFIGDKNDEAQAEYKGRKVLLMRFSKGFV